MKGARTGDERARNILREFHAAEEELVGRTVVMSDGKAGTKLCERDSKNERASGSKRRHDHRIAN